MKVIFITCYGRSGSTLLDLSLSQIKGFETVGELRNLPMRWDTKPNWLCGCGEPISSCEHWKKITSDAFGPDWRAGFEEYYNLFFEVDRFRKIPLLLSKHKPPGFREKQRRYGEIIYKMYQSLIDLTGAEVIVDSSKQPSYGYALSQMPGVEMYTVHLVRDSRASAHSWLRKKKEHWEGAPDRYMDRYSLTKSSLEWDYYHVVQDGFKAVSKDYIVMKYEDFASDPRGQIEKIMAMIGEEGRPLDFIKEDQIKLGKNHTAAGNPMRFQSGWIKIRTDVEWKTKMDRRKKMFVTAITWPNLLRYGYLNLPSPFSRK